MLLEHKFDSVYLITDLNTASMHKNVQTRRARKYEMFGVRHIFGIHQSRPWHTAILRIMSCRSVRRHLTECTCSEKGIVVHFVLKIS